MPTPADMLAAFLWRAGTFLLLTAWILASAWLTAVFARDFYQRWGRWQTYPLPDKRAIKHVVALLALIGANLLFLWFAVVWMVV